MLYLKAAKYEKQKPSTCRATLFRCKFWSMCPVFSPCMINLICNRNICCWSKKCSSLIGWFARARAKLLRAKFWVWWKTSNKASLLHKVDPGSTFRNNFLQPATNVFVAQQVDYARWKRGNIDQNLQRNNVARQDEGFCISYFVALISIIFINRRSVEWWDEWAQAREVAPYFGF